MPSGSSSCHLQFVGGVALILDRHAPQIGDVSTGIRITNLNWSDQVLSIGADVDSTGETTFRLRTPLKLINVSGAVARPLADDTYEVTVSKPLSSKIPSSYEPVKIAITFDNR